MASSQVPSLDPKVAQDAPVVPAYLLNPIPPTNGSIEVLRRQITLLDNLGIDLSVGQYQERFIDDIRYSTT